MAGPLEGLKVVEMVGIGPGPFAAMLLSDMGAEVIRIDRLNAGHKEMRGARLEPRFDVLARGRRSLAIDLQKSGAAEVVLELIAQSDALIEGFRPGVMERMGLGPELCMRRNPALVFGRMTGWGQTGPLAQAAGHDINYISLTGALHAIGSSSEAPVPPLNLVGDFGGGMLMAFGLMCALSETRRSGKGQVVDVSMTDGTALLSSAIYGLKAAGEWSNQRGENLLDGGAHFYGTYACADGKFISVGSIEPHFYALLLERCGVSDPAFDAQLDKHSWPMLKNRLTDVFRTRTREQWCALLEGTDVCFAPVLDWDEAPQHRHNRARETFLNIDGVVQPAPAPRFSRTPAAVPRGPASTPGAHSEAILLDWGISRERVGQLRAAGAICN